MYKRKTYDEYEIQGNYGQGFEAVTSDVTWKEAKVNLRLYRENEPGIAFRVIKRRIPITQTGE